MENSEWDDFVNSVIESMEKAAKACEKEEDRDDDTAYQAFVVTTGGAFVTLIISAFMGIL